MVYLPYYNCNTVYDAVTRAGFAVERYPLDAHRLPVCPALGDGEWLLYVNYFGIASDDLLAEVKRRWPRVIFDNTQAFFYSAPYGCRQLQRLFLPQVRRRAGRRVPCTHGTDRRDLPGGHQLAARGVLVPLHR